MKNTDDFFIRNTDQRILLCFHQYFFKLRKDPEFKPEALNSRFLLYLYYTTLGLEELINRGWEKFKAGPWNNPDFFDAIAFFDHVFLIDLTKRMEGETDYQDEVGDPVQGYAIENEELLQNEMSQAIRFHKDKLKDILPELLKLAQTNEKEYAAIKPEKWRTY